MGASRWRQSRYVKGEWRQGVCFEAMEETQTKEIVIRDKDAKSESTARRDP